jgi:hypothetical protein
MYTLEYFKGSISVFLWDICGPGVNVANMIDGSAVVLPWLQSLVLVFQKKCRALVNDWEEKTLLFP